MKKIQIIEDERFAKYADFDGEIYLLNRTELYPLDERVINIPEVSEGFAPTSMKFNTLLSEIYNKYGDVDYEVITDDKEKFAMDVNFGDKILKVYVTNSFKIVS